MLPELAALPSNAGDGRPIPLILTTGDAEENRRLVETHGVRCPVLLQEQMEVASLYEVDSTPTGYLVDEQGLTAGPLAVGARALLDLAGPPSAGAADRQRSRAELGGNGHRRNLVTRSLVESRIERNGLSAGTPAPSLRPPRLDGGELSLEAYRGRRVLLVFSDPHCGSCDQLAPELERLHRRSPDPQVLVISRGDPESNRAEVAEHGLTFPIALQRHWEISRDYRMFAAPIGYFIDERGVIAADVAVGADAILALAARTARRADGKGAPIGR
jgi:peroxiredoxin